MTEIEPSAAAIVARRGATKLLRLALGDGRFIYRYSAAKGPRPTRKYNLLRHCGAAWSMLDAARQLGEMEAVTVAAQRAIGYLIENCVLPFGDDGARCVVDNGKIKLGGSGLALLAITELFRVNREPALLESARALGRYIVSEQRADGDFVHSRLYATGEERGFRSDYYTGEALFGLVRLHEATGEQHWLDRVIFSEEQLLRNDYGVRPQSHWMLYALEALNAVRSSDAYIEHARRIAENILTVPSYRTEGRSTPIACRSEGLMAYVRMLLHSQASGIWPSASDCLEAVRSNLVLQLEFRTDDGAFVRGGGSDEVRIDYIQHNISAFLAFSKAPTSQTAKASAVHA